MSQWYPSLNERLLSALWQVARHYLQWAHPSQAVDDSVFADHGIHAVTANQLRRLADAGMLIAPPFDAGYYWLSRQGAYELIRRDSTGEVADALSRLMSGLWLLPEDATDTYQYKGVTRTFIVADITPRSYVLTDFALDGLKVAVQGTEAGKPLRPSSVWLAQQCEVLLAHGLVVWQGSSDYGYVVTGDGRFICRALAPSSSLAGIAEMRESPVPVPALDDAKPLSAVIFAQGLPATLSMSRKKILNTIAAYRNLIVMCEGADWTDAAYTSLGSQYASEMQQWITWLRLMDDGVLTSANIADRNSDLWARVSNLPSDFLVIETALEQLEQM